MRGYMEQREIDIIMLFPKAAHLSMRKMSQGFEPKKTRLPVNDTQQRMLMILFHKGPMTMTQLHQAMGLEKGSITSVVDRLIELDLVERKSVAGDRRKVAIELTQTGYGQTESLKVEMAEFIHTKLQKLSEVDRRRFYQAVEVIGEISQKL